VDAVISPSLTQAPSFEYWGVDRNRIFIGLNVIHNHWFSSRVKNYRQNLNSIRNELSLPKKYILGVGRLVHKKNWLKGHKKQLSIIFAENYK
jgi:hypothetical protein